MNDLKKDTIFLTLNFFLGIVLFQNFIFKSELVDIDYGLIRSRIEYFGGFFSFYKHSYQVMDVQPIRDMFFSLIIFLEKIINHQLFGFFQYLFWYLSFFCLYFLFKLENYSFVTRTLGSLFFFVHPIASWSLYWPTSLKHTLALFFISLATYYTHSLKFKKKVDRSDCWKIIIFYFLSVFSQPITLLWVFYFLYYFRFHLKEPPFQRVAMVLCSTFLICGVLNFIYYGQVYPYQSGALKMSGENPIRLVITILSFSRSFFQILFPSHFAIEYSLSSLQNFLGLPLMSLFLFFLYYFKGKTFFLKSLLLISYPLALIYAKPTNIFISDTYLITSLWGFSFVFFSLIENRITIKKVLTILIPLYLILINKTYQESLITSNPDKIFKITYEREPSCKTTIFHAHHLYSNYSFDEFLSVSTDALKNKCLIMGKSADRVTSRVYALYIYLTPLLKKEEKKELLKELNEGDPLIFGLKKRLNLPLKREFLNLKNQIDYDRINEFFDRLDQRRKKMK